MVMEYTIETLELPKILERLARHASFSASQELAVSLRPSADDMEVLARQRITSEAKRFLELKPSASLAAARDIRDLARRAGLGGVLEPRELLDVLATLVAARTIKGALSRLGNQFPSLATVAERITTAGELEREIQKCINPQGEIVDEASPILRRLRVDVRVVHQRLLDRLQNLVNSTTYRHVIQEPIVTLRQGRYVVPVKADFKGQLRGIVLDQSASGSTVFVEPMETVDINNRWRELQLEEQREMQRILRNLSALVAALEDELSETIVALAEIDLALAKAKYSVEIQGVEAGVIRAASAAVGEPHLPGSRLFLDLVNARHPLLGEGVVPIGVRLGGDFFVLVITGPNTGGKTVALKTVGLLPLMAQCGLHIPADEGSRIRVFKRVYADIGDEQSIEQSLSTFSSHLRRVIEVLANADEHSLVLLDEIGAGTDPTEGSALARALLSFLVKRQVPTIATTHYSELKAYAHATPGVENASVEFDVETLAPTFRLSIGLPGRSNALAIAHRLGVPAEVTDAAVKLLSASETQVDQLLSRIQLERDRAASERGADERARREAEKLRDELAKRLRAIEQERQAVIDQARREVDAEISEVRLRLRAAMASASKQSVSRLELLSAMSEVKAVQDEVDRNVEATGHSSEITVGATGRSPLPGSETENRLLGEVPPQESSGSQAVAGQRDAAEQADNAGRRLRVGDYVLVRSLGQYGELLSLPDLRGEAEVQLGSFKVKVRARDVERTKARPKTAADYFPQYQVSLEVRPQPPPELGVHGWRVEQMLPELDRYLNDSYLAGLQTVRIVHGKGTGVLRRVVREQLAHHPLVRSYGSADSRDGGDGVTVVHLAS